MGHFGAERWFHTLVVMGASLAGCGGTLAKEPTPSPELGGGGAGGRANAGRSGLGTAGAPRISDCAFAAQFVCQDYKTLTGCRCDPSAPLDKSACASPFDFVCDDGPCEPPPENSAPSLCTAGPAVGCRCDPQAPRPEDCATPEQFFCNTITNRYIDCACAPASSSTAESCPDEFCCQSANPRFGCGCDCILIR